VRVRLLVHTRRELRQRLQTQLFAKKLDGSLFFDQIA
jgi:hypothetical protein